MIHSFRRALFSVLLTVVAGASLWGQSTNATISGVIRDAQGAAIPTAVVTVSQAQTGLSRQVKAGDNGYYSIPNLPIGDYRVSINSSGFKTAVIPSLTLQINQNAELNVDLEVGAVSEQINVSSDVPLLTTESSSIGTVIENRSIQSLALNGRQFWQLVASSLEPATPPSATGRGPAEVPSGLRR